MANRSPVALNATRSLAFSAAILFLAAPAHADPIKYALVNAMFDDGGQATGYVLYELPPAPGTPQVTDWAINVIGGTSGIARFAYDPTNSTLNVVFNPGGSPNVMSFTGPAYTAPACGGTPRIIQFDLLQFGTLAGETCGTTTRHFGSGDFQRVPGPVLTLKIGNQHPASRLVFGGGVFLTLDVSPAGWTTPLDWYWAIKFEQSLFWVTAGGLSTTPAPFAHAAPLLVSNVPLLFTLLPGNTQTTFAIFVSDGSSIISLDSMTAIVPPSP